MKNTTVSLNQWGKKFTKKQKQEAKKANDYYEVVKEFKKIRKELGFTQQALADKIGIDRTVITKIETGARNTTINSLLMFADAMGKKLKISFV